MFGLVLVGFFLVLLVAAIIVVALAFAGTTRPDGVKFAKRATPLPPKQLGAVLRQVSDADIELEIKKGRVITAIRLYQEKTGAGAVEAKAAVDAWRERLRAS